MSWTALVEVQDVTLGLAVGDDHWSVGSPELLHAFFSTVSHRLESGGWGTRFPMLVGRLYDGELPVDAVETALSELALVRRELAWFAPAEVVWDIDDLAAQPPWGGAIADSVPDLSRYFFTVDSRDLFDVLAAALAALQQQGPGAALRIVAATPVLV